MIGTTTSDVLTFVFFVIFTGACATLLYTLIVRSTRPPEKVSARVQKAQDDALVAQAALESARANAETDMVEVRRHALLDAAKQGPEELEAAITRLRVEKERNRYL